MQAITTTEIEAMTQKQLLAHLGLTAKEAQKQFPDTKVSLSKQLREYALSQAIALPAEVAHVVEVAQEVVPVEAVEAVETEYFVSQPEESYIDFEGSLEECIAKADELQIANKGSYMVYNQQGEPFYNARATKRKPAKEKQAPSNNKVKASTSLNLNVNKVTRVTQESKEINYAPGSQVKTVREGTKIDTIIKMLTYGTSLDELNQAINKKMTPSYVAQRLALRGYGLKQIEDKLYLVTPTT